MTISEEVFSSYMKAGKAVGHALKLAQEIARPGTNMLDLGNLLEQDILDQGADGWAFPANISLDDQAAHYSPVIDDEIILPKKGLLKVDLGAQVDEYVADAAVTINLGDDKGIYDDIVQASRDALYAAIKAFKPGVNVSEIGGIIEDEITKYKGVRPVSNLGGHQLKKGNLHAGVFVPNIRQSSSSYVIQEGDTFAVEPFATNGYGAIKNGKIMTIYRYKGSSHVSGLKKRDILGLRPFKEKFHSLPFSPRWIDFIPKDQINKKIQSLYRRGILEGYYVFMEQGKGIVSQAEHTLVVKDGKAIPTTWWEDWDYNELYD